MQVNSPSLLALLKEADALGAADLKKLERQPLGPTASLGSYLIKSGLLSEATLLGVYASALGIPTLPAHELPTDMGRFALALARLELDPDFCADQGFLPYGAEDDSLMVCLRYNVSLQVLEYLQRRLQPPTTARFVFIPMQAFDSLLTRLKSLLESQSDAGGLDESHLREMAEEAPVIEFVNNLLSQAYEQHASDIHIEPAEEFLTCRFRIDGVLYVKYQLPIERYSAISSRIKLISGIDISEKRLPQDGRFGIKLAGQDVDLRVSTMPGTYGESLVLRLLPKDSKQLTLSDLGLAPDHRTLFESWLGLSNGIVLVTGPTGSGKSTTLYAALAHVASEANKIITVEDPVEMNVAGVTQVQVNAEIGFTFARALRSILRQDPDIIMIGEIRDLETAQIAVQSSFTGHLVLSTLHTNDAVSSFTRLIDMGLEPFLVANPVRGVIAQRLIRRLCPQCKKPVPPTPEMVELHQRHLAGVLPAQQCHWYTARGCTQCHGTGYAGRIGIYELVPVDVQMQELILRSSSTVEIAAYAASQCRSLFQDGLHKVVQGLSTLDELYRVVNLQGDTE